MEKKILTQLIEAAKNGYIERFIDFTGWRLDAFDLAKIIKEINGTYAEAIVMNKTLEEAQNCLAANLKSAFEKESN